MFWIIILAVQLILILLYLVRVKPEVSESKIISFCTKGILFNGIIILVVVMIKYR